MPSQLLPGAETEFDGLKQKKEGHRMFVQLKKLAVASMVVVMAATSTGCVKGGGLNPNIEGIVGPDVEFVNGRVILTMVFKNIALDGGATIPIPKYPNSSVQVGPDFLSAGTLLQVTIAAEDFLGDRGTKFDPQTLPGGRPIPTIAAGNLPAIAIQVPQLWNAVFYVGPEVLGLFVPFNKLNLAGSILSFRFHNKAGEPVGMLSLVGSDAEGKNAGILAMMRADLMGILKKPSSSTLRQLAQMY
jgi:hypothetical protein